MSRANDDVDSASVRFPIFYRIDTLDTLPAAAIGLVLALVMLSIGRHVFGGVKSVFVVLGVLFLLLSARYLVPLVQHDLHNRRIRRQWAQSFESQIRPSQLRSLLKSDPTRYVLHIKYYGGFDAIYLASAIVLEDKDGSALLAVYPPTEVTTWVEALGVLVIKY